MAEYLLHCCGIEETCIFIVEYCDRRRENSVVILSTVLQQRSIVTEQLNFVMDKVSLCLTVGHYVGAWHDCSKPEELCHRKLKDYDKIEEYTDHQEEHCNWTVKYYNMTGEHRMVGVL